MKTNRVIFVYDKRLEKLIDEISIDISIESLRTIFIPYDNDLDLIMSYDITDEKAVFIEDLININFDLENNIYQMGCYQE